MTDENAAVLRRAVDRVWNRGDLTAADRLFTASYVNHGGLIPDLVRGPEAIKFSVALYRAAFPGLCIAVYELETDEDMVVFGWTARMPRRDTGHRSEVDALRDKVTGRTSSRFVCGQIAETWMTCDGACPRRPVPRAGRRRWES